MHEVTECKHPLKVQSKPVISTVHSHTPHQQISVLDNVLWTPSCCFLTHRALWDISDEVFSVCCVLKSHSFLWYRLSHWIQSLANSERNLVHISITYNSVMTSLWRRTHTRTKSTTSRHVTPHLWNSNTLLWTMTLLGATDIHSFKTMCLNFKDVARRDAELHLSSGVWLPSEFSMVIYMAMLFVWSWWRLSTDNTSTDLLLWACKKYFFCTYNIQYMK